MLINNERLLKTFIEYVQIDSETGYEKEFTDHVQADLKALGLNAVQDDSGTTLNSTGNNIYCYIEGDNSLEPIFFSAHLDTVTPGKGIKPIIEDGIIKSDGTTILGGDDKAGLAAIIEAVRTLKENNIPHRPIELIFTIREESGLCGSKQFDSRILKSKMGFIMDAGGESGTMIVAGPSQMNLKATVIGKASHAACYPQKGISAIQVLAHAVSNMNLLGIDEETTANIGTFQAQYPTNIVPEKASIVAEARSRNFEKLLAQIEHMKKCLDDACTKFGATVEIEVDTAYREYNTAPNSPIIELFAKKCGELGLPVISEVTCGGSDANILANKGLEVINITAGIELAHTTEEQLQICNLEASARLTLKLMKA